jgi:putative Mg2+ transporter-C (MgtC) family protein
MPVTVEWSGIALQLALTIAAGTSLGLNRSERGRPAGLCTMSLVCLAASGAIIQANLLLATTGKAPDSFIMLDLMPYSVSPISNTGGFRVQ